MSDERFMALALAEARRALGSTSPNPAVGAVIVRDGAILGRGFTKPPGREHAEVSAIQDAAAQRHDVRGATMYVTLEPCCHHGRTPPCTDAILAAGLSRVVVGIVDPFPAVSGRGIELLRRGGIEVLVGVLEEACIAMVRGFLRVTTGGMPEVSVKTAISLDGRIATARGESKWITGPEARAHGHGLRAEHDAILIGRGTAVADDPRLTCRVVDGSDPVPVVLDSRLQIAADAQLFQGPRRPLVFCSDAADVASRTEAYRADVIAVPSKPTGLDLEAVLAELGRRGILRVLVEGGGHVTRSFLDARLVDHIYVYIAGTVIPGGQSWVAGPPLRLLGDAPRFGAPEVTVLGDDVLLHYTSPLDEVRP